jgi:hypothetical protein
MKTQILIVFGITVLISGSIMIMLYKHARELQKEAKEKKASEQAEPHLDSRE